MVPLPPHPLNCHHFLFPHKLGTAQYIKLVLSNYLIAECLVDSFAFYLSQHTSSLCADLRCHEVLFPFTQTTYQQHRSAGDESLFCLSEFNLYF
jgi:hypothetical protein